MAGRSRGFPPVVDAGIETLILGSFPSVASLGKAQYYGHPQNQFWRLVGAVIDEPLLPKMDYAERKRMLLKHHIGLWDVVGACEREGSLDSNIRNQRDNDFSRVLSKAKKLRRIFFNGKKAAEKELIFKSRYETAVLPSSSPANTMRFAEKLRQWRQIAAPLRPARRVGGRPGSRASRLSPLASPQKC
jgi:hypoxanthine-DNA glycosylase